jgi:hypothetical protein
MRSTLGFFFAFFVLGAIICAGPGASAQGEKPAAASPPQPAQIDRNGALILIRSALLALDQANKTGNYTVLRDLGAPGFQAANTAARLGEIFAKQRNDNLDLSGVLVLDPQLTALPQIDSGGLLRMAGFFPSVPLQVNFDLAFAPVAGKWRLFGVSVNVGPSGPVAPEPPPVAAAQPEAKPPKSAKKTRTPKPAKANTPSKPAAPPSSE